LRPDRRKYHRRYLWRRRAAWRRRPFPARTRPRSRPLGRLCRALSRQERSSRRASPSAARSGRLCDRQSPSRCRFYVETTAPANVVRGQADRAFLQELMGFVAARHPPPILGLNKPIYARTAASTAISVRPTETDGRLLPGERLDLVRRKAPRVLILCHSGARLKAVSPGIHFPEAGVTRCPGFSARPGAPE